MYHLLHLINTKYPTIRGGFIHVPFLPEQTIDKPTFASMSLEAITDSLFYMIEAKSKNARRYSTTRWHNPLINRSVEQNHFDFCSTLKTDKRRNRSNSFGNKPKFSKN